MSDREISIEYARALGIAMGHLDSIVISAESAMTNFRGANLQNERILELGTLARNGLARISKILPEMSDLMPDDSLELRCGHWVKRFPDVPTGITALYSCPICGRTWLM